MNRHSFYDACNTPRQGRLAGGRLPLDELRGSLAAARTLAAAVRASPAFDTRRPVATRRSGGTSHHGGRAAGSGRATGLKHAICGSAAWTCLRRNKAGVRLSDSDTSIDQKHSEFASISAMRPDLGHKTRNIEHQADECASRAASVHLSDFRTFRTTASIIDGIQCCKAISISPFPPRFMH